MRIAQIAPLAESVPPKLYGGTERVVAWLIDELVELGHDVTLFASGNSQTRAKLVPVWPYAFRLGRPRTDPVAVQAVLLETMAQRAAEFDVIHCHIDWLHLPLLTRSGVPFLTHLARPPGHRRPAAMSCATFPTRRSCRSRTTSACRCPAPTGWAPSITAFLSNSLQPSLRAWIVSCLPRPADQGEGT